MIISTEQKTSSVIGGSCRPDQDPAQMVPNVPWAELKFIYRSTTVALHRVCVLYILYRTVSHCVRENENVVETRSSARVIKQVTFVVLVLYRFRLCYHSIIWDTAGGSKTKVHSMNVRVCIYSLGIISGANMSSDHKGRTWSKYSLLGS